MCTALSFVSGDHYFGRTLDLDRSYGEEVCIMPRRCALSFRHAEAMPCHFAMIGMATVVSGTPLFYEAGNEYGLAMAGLNFPGNAYYGKPRAGKDNIASFELIPWILGQCKTVREARELLSHTVIVDTPCAPTLPPSPLHFMIAGRDGALVLEPMKDGLHIYDNPLRVMTNNPPFPVQLENWEKYRHLRTDNAGIEREEDLPYVSYCQGLGAVGLPGDVSSMSRFVRIAFGQENAVRPEEEPSAVGQFFHLLSSVGMIRGLCRTDEGTWDITGYTACINLDHGRYYYTTYGNRRITCVDMHKTDLDSQAVTRFPLLTAESICYQNG